VVLATQGGGGNYLQRTPRPSGLADVVDLILDKGLVIDAYVRVAVIGIELITIDARIVIASVDTYLRFAEAVNRLDLRENAGADLGDLAGGSDDRDGDAGGSRGEKADKARGMLEGARDAVGSGTDKVKERVGRG
jgi:hypothetical protein